MSINKIGWSSQSIKGGYLENKDKILKFLERLGESEARDVKIIVEGTGPDQKTSVIYPVRIIGNSPILFGASVDSEIDLDTPYQLETLLSNVHVKIDDGIINVKSIPQGAIAVIREGQNGVGTWGYLFTFDGDKAVFQGYTLEPRSGVGKGPIPLGDYNYSHWISEKLGKTERLQNVPGFTDILIHVGNFPGQTQGCILAGRGVDSLKDPKQLTDSRSLTDWLYDNKVSGTVFLRSK